MTVNDFKREFKQVNFVYLKDGIILFRKPLEIYDEEADKTIQRFKGNDTDPVLDFVLDGETVREIINKWDDLPRIFADAKGSRTGDSYSKTWTMSRKGRGKGERDQADLPARLNTKVAATKRDYQDMLNAFIKLHADSDTEHGITIDTHGFATQYIHGGKGSVGIWGKKGEMVIHNHPSDGYPNFSKDDILSVTQSKERGIVAVSAKKGRDKATARYAGTYTFEKTQHFDATGLTKALKRAQISGKNYDDAVSNWLKKNQKRYGYKYSYVPAQK